MRSFLLLAMLCAPAYAFAQKGEVITPERINIGYDNPRDKNTPNIGKGKDGLNSDKAGKSEASKAAKANGKAIIDANKVANNTHTRAQRDFIVKQFEAERTKAAMDHRPADAQYYKEQKERFQQAGPLNFNGYYPKIVK